MDATMDAPMDENENRHEDFDLNGYTLNSEIHPTPDHSLGIPPHNNYIVGTISPMTGPSQPPLSQSAHSNHIQSQIQNQNPISNDNSTVNIANLAFASNSGSLLTGLDPLYSNSISFTSLNSKNKGLDCCGRRISSLHDLLLHYEQQHPGILDENNNNNNHINQNIHGQIQSLSQNQNQSQSQNQTQIPNIRTQHSNDSNDTLMASLNSYSIPTSLNVNTEDINSQSRIPTSSGLILCNPFANKSNNNNSNITVSTPDNSNNYTNLNRTPGSNNEFLSPISSSNVSTPTSYTPSYNNFGINLDDGYNDLLTTPLQSHQMLHPQQQLQLQASSFQMPTHTHIQIQQFDDPSRSLYILSPDSTSRPYKCSVRTCTKSYKNSNGLKYHMRHGHKGQNLQLNPDGTYGILGADGDLQDDAITRKIMENEKPHLCRVCGRRYKNMNGLKYHRAHSFH